MAASAAPVVTGMPDVVAVVGKDGAIHGASATSKSLVSLEADDKGWKEATNTSLTLTSGTDLAITAVGILAAGLTVSAVAALLVVSRYLCEKDRGPRPPDQS